VGDAEEGAEFLHRSCVGGWGDCMGRGGASSSLTR